MRILVHGINFAPELTGIGKFSGEMVRWLADKGHDVRVVTAPPYYPAWRVATAYSSWRYRRERMSFISSDRADDRNKTGAVVYRCPLWVPSRPSGLKRLIHLASFALSSFPVMLRQAFWRPHVVFVVEPTLMCAPAALLVARLGGAKSWLHIQDFEVDAAFDLGILPPGRLRQMILAVERLILREFDRVSTISSRMLDRLAGKGVEQTRTVLFPNWVDTQAIFPQAHVGALRASLGIPEDAIVGLYSGNIGEKQGLEVVLDAAQQLASERRIKFVLCGDGAAKSRLRQAYAHVANVVWLPLQPLEKLNDLLNMADIHLLPQRADAADLVMPSKLTGMLASGRPVVATAFAQTQLAEVVSKCGIVVRPDDVAGFAAAVSELAQDAERRTVLGKAARAHAERYMGKDSVLREFERNLGALVG